MPLFQRVRRPLLPQAQLHQRLALSRADFKHAAVAAEIILGRKRHEKYRGVNAHVLRAMNCSMLLAYTRPFCGAQARRAESVAALPAKVLRVLTREERKLHNEVVRSRNKCLAHTDADAVALETIVFIGPSGNESLVHRCVDRLAPLDAASTRVLAGSARKLLEVTQLLATDLEARLRPYSRVATSAESLLAGDARPFVPPDGLQRASPASFRDSHVGQAIPLRAHCDDPNQDASGPSRSGIVPCSSFARRWIQRGVSAHARQG
jgi:hypothetical protein